MRKRPSGDAEGGRGSVCPARFGHIPSAFPHSRHIFLNVRDFTSEPFRREIAHSVEGLMDGVHFFYKTSNSILFLLLRELWNKYDVETLLRSEISFANVNCGISLRNGRWDGVRGTCAALGAWRPNGPPREGRAPARPGDLCTWAGLRLQSVNTESAEARRHGEFWGPTRDPCILHHFTRTGEGRAPARPISPISELPPTHPSDFDIISVTFRFSEGSIGRELMRQHAVFHPATA